MCLILRNWQKRADELPAWEDNEEMQSDTRGGSAEQYPKCRQVAH